MGGICSKHMENIIYEAQFEVLTTVVIECSSFLDVMPCSSLKLNRCFGGTYSFHLQGSSKKPVLLATCVILVKGNIKFLKLTVVQSD
jgi:hypothetical protein